MLFVRVHKFHRFAEGFTEADFGFAHVGFHAELGAHAVDGDFQMQLAHAAQYGLPGFMIHLQLERRIGAHHFVERGGHFVDVGAGLGFHRDADHGVGEAHALQQHRRGGIAQCVAGLRFLHRHEGADIAGAHFVDVLGVISLYFDDTPDALFLAARGIDKRIALLDHA